VKAKRFIKSKRAVRQSNKPPPAWQRQTGDRDKAPDVEGPDRLLLSALKFWEVERDLIEERVGAVRSGPSSKPPRIENGSPVGSKR
jgi:hypothetical protein